MRILFVAESLRGNSGWGRYTNDITTELAARGHEVEALVHAATDESTLPQHRGLPAPLACISNPLHAWKSAGVLSRTVRKTRPDIVHIAVEPYATALSLRPIDRPTVLTVHGTYAVLPLRLNIPSRWMAARYLALVTRIASVSRFTAKALEDALPSHMRADIAAKTEVIHNGIRLPDNPAVRPKAAGPHRILVVSSLLKERKGILEIVRACGAFKRKYGDDFICSIIGRIEEKDPYLSALRGAIADLGLERNVILHGRVSEGELRQAYDQADLFMLLSLETETHFEGFGLVFLEANARGIPVIGPRTGGCPEAIEDGKSGYVCDPMDTETVAERMADVLVRTTIQRDECLAWARSHDIRITVDALEKLYAKALA